MSLCVGRGVQSFLQQVYAMTRMLLYYRVLLAPKETEAKWDHKDLRYIQCHSSVQHIQ